MNILSLPSEIQSHILHFLPWHDHFLAASVCPLWQSILSHSIFRRKRYYGTPLSAVPVNLIERERHARLHQLVFNDQCPRWNKNDNRDEDKLGIHGLLELQVLSMVVGRDGGYAQVPGNIQVSMGVNKGIIHNITTSPILDLDLIFYNSSPPNTSPEEIRNNKFLTIRFQTKFLTNGSDGNLYDEIESGRKGMGIPLLNLRKDIWFGKEGTLKALLEAIGAHIFIYAMKDKHVCECRVHFQEYSRARGTYVVGVSVVREEELAKKRGWLKGVLGLG